MTSRDRIFHFHLIGKVQLPRSVKESEEKRV